MAKLSITASCFVSSLCLLAGCAANTGVYPSLAQRPVERTNPAAVPSAATRAPNPALFGPPTVVPEQIAAILTAAREADATFQNKLAEQRPVIDAGRSAPAGSEKWVLAQEAYSAVDSARGGIATALADLDRLHQESVASGDRNRQAQVESAIGQLQALDQGERALLAQLLPAA
ncbi:hypothetical protein SAMN05444678_10123 [Sphingomonas sp. YR710]|uniref:hypothetical protein n=1 Tax=Sphingomonas sp. YR710 TaxID=1882773 RepID=UPI000880B373|nr:hypothetical protein [Sphingomonas sp. YR710]SDB98480.1 hypothetical protein SAMN05444678_10123 [Sphingomonas sp. YR710]